MMTIQTTMVVLANSIKMHGACVAGRVADESGAGPNWVRPVMDLAGGTLPVFRTMCSDGRFAQVLDVVSMPLGDAVPMLHQQENRLLEHGFWIRRRRYGWDELRGLVEQSGSGLWLDGFSSSCGLNDRIPEVLLPRIGDSLRLVSAQDVVLHRTTDCYGRRRIRAFFAHEGQRYDLAVTDPMASFLLDGEDERDLGEIFLSISLGVPFHGNAYKLVAAIITPERAGYSS